MAHWPPRANRRQGLPSWHGLLKSTEVNPRWGR